MSTATEGTQVPFSTKALGRLYRAKEVAGLLGVSLKTVRRMIRGGRLKAIDISFGEQAKRPSWRIAEVDLKEFLETTNGASSDA